MPLIFKAAKDNNGNNIIVGYDPDQDAKVGRWCKAPQLPDRCNLCWDKETLGRYPAEGYYEEKDPDGTVWRYGVCRRCLAEHKRRKRKVIMY